MVSTRITAYLTVLLGMAVAGAAADPPVPPPAHVGPGTGVDLRPIFAAWGLGPRQQGNRNTCSAFVVTGALEFALAKKTDRGTRLSVEFLNWASNAALGEAEDGGYFSDLWKGFAAHGICAEEDMPYLLAFAARGEPSPRAIGRAAEVRKERLRFHWIKEWDVKTGLTEAQLEKIRRTVRLGWPVCGGFRWPKEQVWDDGVLRICPPDAVRDGHSVLIVGYVDDPARPGGGLCIIRNTAKDGRDGYLTYEYVKAYMNDAAWIDFEAALEGALQLSSANASRSVLGPFGGLPAGRNRRISSNEQPAWNDANFDMTMLPPGQALERDRYLKDENGVPLVSRREDDWFAVESRGPGAWTHRWQGLDARR